MRKFKSLLKVMIWKWDFYILYLFYDKSSTITYCDYMNDKYPDKFLEVVCRKHKDEYGW